MTYSRFQQALWILLLFSLHPPTPCLELVVPIPTPVCCYDTSPLFVKRHRGTWRPQPHFLTRRLPCEPQHVTRAAAHSTNTDHKLLPYSSYSRNNKTYFIIAKHNQYQTQVRGFQFIQVYHFHWIAEWFCFVHYNVMDLPSSMQASYKIS